MRQVESAQLVWDALAKAGPKGLSREQLVLKTGLTRHQVVHAFAYIKDALMDHYEQPLIYDSVQNVYSLPPKWREAGDYIDYRIHGILVMVRRVELVADASEKKWGDKKTIADVQRRVRHLREDLEALSVATS
jgi:hypothetical protein